MPDLTYQAKVYKKGPDELIVASGGKITVEAGGSITGSIVAASTADFGDLTDNSGGAAADGTIATVRSDTVAHAAADANDAVKELATKINAINAALRTAGILV